MKQIMALFLASSLMVPLLSTDALCATATAATPHKKGSEHKRHAHRAKATTGAASDRKAAPRQTTESQN